MTIESSSRLRELKEQLDQLNQRFEAELRARGFDPIQIETAALPSALAKLYLKKQLLEEELQQLATNTT